MFEGDRFSDREFNMSDCVQGRCASKLVSLCAQSVKFLGDQRLSDPSGINNSTYVQVPRVLVEGPSIPTINQKVECSLNRDSTMSILSRHLESKCYGISLRGRPQLI